MLPQHHHVRLYLFFMFHHCFMTQHKRMDAFSKYFSFILLVLFFLNEIIDF